MSEGDNDMEAVDWVAETVLDVLGELEGALRGLPRLTGEEMHVVGVGVVDTIPYHSTSVGKSPVIYACWNVFLAMW